jgi:hypothetical protein
MRRNSKSFLLLVGIWGLIVAGIIVAVIPSTPPMQFPQQSPAIPAAKSPDSPIVQTETVTQGPIDPTTQISPGTGSLSGTVRDTKGDILQGAVVLVSTPAGRAYYDRSDDQGQYEIRDIPAGSYTPVSSKSGYLITSLESLFIGPGRRTTGLDFRLEEQMRVGLQQETLTTWDIRLDSEAQRPLAYLRVYTLEAIDDLFQIYFYTPEAASRSLPLIIAIWPNEVELGERLWAALASEGYLVAVFRHSYNIEPEVQRISVTLSLLHSGEFDVKMDEESIGLYGASAGSLITHRAIQELSNIKALVTSGGLADLFLYREDLLRGGYETALDHGAGYHFQILGDPSEQPEEYLKYSSAFYADSIPPTLTIHAVNDYLVPVDQAYRLSEALDSFGRINEMYIIDDASHYLLPFGVADTEWGEDDLYWTVISFYNRFLR